MSISRFLRKIKFQTTLAVALSGVVVAIGGGILHQNQHVNLVAFASTLGVGSGTAGSCTQTEIQNAINSSSNGDTINFNCGSNTRINFGSQIVIAKNLTFDGSLSPNLTFDGQGSTRLFKIDAEKIVTFKNLNFENGKVNGMAESDILSSGGGAIIVENRTELTLENTKFKNNVAGFGGAVLVKYYTKLNVINSTFEANSALVPNSSSERSGGAITILTAGMTNITGSTFIGNTSAGIGGAINSLLSGLNVEDSVFKNNTSQTVGGAIYTDGLDEFTNDGLGGTSVIRNTRFENNFSGQDGGAGYLFIYPNDKLDIFDSTFIDNKAPNGLGGALRLGLNNTTINNTAFVRNEAKNGGGITIQNAGDVDMKNVLFEQNTATENGGAIVANSPSGDRISIENATFNKNYAADYNGAITVWNKPLNDITLKNTVFFENTAGNPYDSGHNTPGNLGDGGNNFQFPNTYQNTTFSGYTNVTQAAVIKDPLLSAFVDTGVEIQNTPCVTEPTIQNAGAGFICAPLPNKLPTVTITSPSNNQNFNNPANFIITGTTNDTDGTVAKVEIFNGTTKLGDAVLNGTNWNFNVTGLTSGTYNLIAKATDNQGATKDATVSVVVGSTSSLAVAAINPNQGPIEGANTVTITGNGFNNVGNNGKYTKPLTVNNPNGALYGYQISQTLDTQALITAGKIKNDCSDLRVRDTNGNDLPYWIEPGTCNTPNTKIWFRAGNLPNGNSTFNLTYGNSNWNSTQNPQDIFPFFDSFDGSGAMNSAMWRDLTAPSGVTYSRDNGELKIAGTAGGFGPIGIRPSMSYDYLLKNGGEFTIEASIRAVTVNGGAIHPGSGVSSCLELRGGTSKDIGCFSGGAVVKGTSDFYNGTPFGTQSVGLDYRGTNPNRTVTYFENGIDKATNTTSSDILFAYNPLTSGTKTFDIRFDNIRVRQLAAQDVSSTSQNEQNNQNLQVKIGNNNCTSVSIISNTQLTCVIPAATAGTVNVALNNILANETTTLAQGYQYGTLIPTPTPTVVINEINQVGSSNSVTDQWIEIYNTTNEVIDISNFVVENLGNSGMQNITLNSSVCSNVSVPANGYFLISKLDKNSSLSNLNVDSDCVVSSMDIGVSEKLILKNGSGVLVDETP